MRVFSIQLHSTAVPCVHRLLDLGFEKDVSTLISTLQGLSLEHQTVLLSATLSAGKYVYHSVFPNGILVSTFNIQCFQMVYLLITF